MRIERLRWWHIERLMPIEADLFGAEQWSAAMFWNELANGHYYLVATENDGGPDGAEAPDGDGTCDCVIGYAGLTLSQGEAWVQNIAVRREWQRRGVGRALLEGLLAEAARCEARQVLLEVAVDNLAAQRLYDVYGFQAVGIRRGYYQPSNIDALVMRRDMVTGDA